MAGLGDGIDRDTPPPRRRGPQPAHPPPADLLPLRGAGRRADDVAARGARRCAQLGLPLRLAARRQHRHRRLPRGRASTTRPARSWPGCCSATRLDRPRLPVLLTLHGKHPRTRTRADGLARLRRQRAGPVGQRRGRPAPARRLRLGPRRRPGGSASGHPLYVRDLARPWPVSPTRWRTVGASPMPASGRSAPTPPTTCIPS